MQLSSFNSYLLQKFSKNLRIGPDVRSLLRRYQTLSIIYANFAIIMMVIFFEIACLLFGLQYHYILAIIAPFVLISFISLRHGCNDIAASSVLIYLHLGNAYASHFCQASLTALTTIYMFPNFSFFMSSSVKVQVFNLVLCLVQSFGHIMNFRNIFAVTLTTEQTNEINQLTAVAIGCLGFLCFMVVVQKEIEANIWQVACQDHEKAENITKEVMQAVEAKETFISSLSHEIRNPLNSLNGSISYLLEVVRDPKLLQVLYNAKLSGETLLNLINNLLDTAKLKAEKMEVLYSETNLNDVFNKVLKINSENLKQKNLFVDLFTSKTIPKVIWSDSSRLLQVIMNLLSNSIKFTPPSGKITIFATWCHRDQTKEELLTPIFPGFSHSFESIHSDCYIETTAVTEPTLTLQNRLSSVDEFSFEEAEEQRSRVFRIKEFQTRGLDQLKNGRNITAYEPWKFHPLAYNRNNLTPSREDQNRTQNNTNTGFLKIQISDNGCGIAQRDIPKLFEMFAQAHRNVTTSQSGTGLGLWICKQVCQKMGGDIRLFSEVGRGTNFVFYVSVDNTSLPKLRSFYSIESSMASDKVMSLVVDDYAYNRDLHKLLLEREGVQVDLATNGQEAVQKYLLNCRTLDFIMMDVQMPVMDGFTAAKSIRQLEADNKWKKVDIYFVSGEYYNEDEVMTSFRNVCGADETLGIRCLKKPVDVETIKKIAEKYRKKLY